MAGKVMGGALGRMWHILRYDWRAWSGFIILEICKWCIELT